MPASESEGSTTMTNTGAFDATLVTAEADLSCAAIGSIYDNAGCDAIRLKLDRVRPYCRELRVALAELDELASPANVDKVRTNCRDLRTVFIALNPSATIPFRCDDPACLIFCAPRTTCWLNQLEALIAADGRLETSSGSLTRTSVPTPDEAILKTDIHVSAQKSNPRDAS